MRVRSTILGLSALALVAATSPVKAQAGSDGGGAVWATLGGAVVGGAIGYYYWPASRVAATTIGVVVGGAVGRWWYSASDGSGDYESAPRRPTNASEFDKPFHLIGYPDAGRPDIRLAQ